MKPLVTIEKDANDGQVEIALPASLKTFTANGSGQVPRAYATRARRQQITRRQYAGGSAVESHHDYRDRLGGDGEEVTRVPLR